MIYKIVSFLIVALFISCSNVDPNNDPNPLYGMDGRYGSFVQDTIYAQADTVLKGKYLFTGLSSKLSMGEYDGMSSGFEIMYTILPPDSVIVDSVQLKFSTLNSFGPNANEVINGTMYRVIDTLITDSVNISDIWRNPLDPSFVSEIGPISFKLQDSAVTSIELPLELFNDWRTNSSENNGLYFHPQEEDVIVELGSRNSSFDPILVFYTHNTEDSVIIDTLSSVSDASIFNYDDVNGSALNLENNKILVSSGNNSRSLLKFDMSGLPKNAIFYSTDLILTEDDSNPYENSENNTSFLLRPLEELTTSQDDFVFSPNRVFSLISSDGFTKVLGTHKNDLSTDVVQAIGNGTLKNEWFLIEFFSNSDDLSVKRFWGVNADKAVSPKVIVKYLNANK